MFATNGYVEALDLPENRRNLSKYQVLPAKLSDLTTDFPWRIQGDSLRWNDSAADPFMQFTWRMNAPFYKVQLYKRFEFPAGLNYVPEGSEIYDNIFDNQDPIRIITTYDIDRSRIANPTSKILKLVIAVHGWNPKPNLDPFNEGAWVPLMRNVHNEIMNYPVLAPNWDLYAYSWGQDSYTGPALGGGKHREGGLGKGMENGTQAAEIGYQHGLNLGKLIRDHCNSNGIDLQKVHFIAHSAGTWVARSASLYLEQTKGTQTNGSSSLIQQISLLDPYNPGSAWIEDGSDATLDGSNLNTEKLTSGWGSNISKSRIENIYSKDKLIIGTNEEYVGGTNEEYSSYINKKVGDSVYPKGGGFFTKWDDHSGPINFYAFTVNPDDPDTRSGFDAFSNDGCSAAVGWQQSLFRQDFLQGNPAPLTGVGAVVSASPSSVARLANSGPSFAPSASPWKRILVDVDGNAWVRAMLMPANGGAAEMAGPVRLGDDGSFSMELPGGGTLTGSFDTGVTPARVSLVVNGVAFGVPTPVAQGSNARRGVDADVNSAGNLVFSMVLADGTVGLSAEENDSGTGWAASGTGTVDGAGNFNVSGSNGFAVGGTLDGDGGLNMDTVTVDPPQVPEIVVEQPSGTDLASGATRDLGAVALGNSSSLTFTIKNTGNANLTGLTVTRDGAHAGDFTVTANPSSLVAGPGGSTAFTVRFAPSAAGTRTAAIHIASNDADENPFDIGLSGTGVLPPVPEIDIVYGKKNLTDGKTAVNIGSAKVKGTLKKNFTIRNRGTATLSLGKITMNGKHAKEFTVSKPKSAKLAPGASTTFIVTFKPKAKGIRNAAIHVVNNDKNEGPFDIKLKGTGKVPAKKSATLADMVMKDFTGSGVLQRPVTGSVVLPDGKRYLTLTLEKTTLSDHHEVEVSPNLMDWYSGPRHTSVLQDDEAWFRVRDNTPLTPESKRFIRVKP